jgi:MFS family permease
MLALGLFAQAASAALLQGLPALGPRLIDRYRLSLGGLGLVLASTAIGMLLTLLAWGLLADRVGERPVIAAGMACGALGLLVALAGSGRDTLMAGLLLAGMGSSSVNAASGRVVLNWFPLAERGLAMGLRQAGVPIGGAAGAAALPAVALLGGVRAALLCMVALFLLAAASAALWLRDAPSSGEQTSPAGRREQAGTGERARGRDRGDAGGGATGAAGPGNPATPSPLKDRRVWRLAAVSGLLVLLQYSIVAYLVVFLHTQRGVSLRDAAATLVVLQVLGAGSRVAVGRWSDRRGDRVGLLRRIALLAAGAFPLLGALAGAPLGALVPALLLAGLLALSWNGLAFTAAGEVAGAARSGTAIGLQNTMVIAGGAVTPPLFAALVGATSWSAAFALLAVAPTVAAALLGGRPRSRRPGPVVP